MADVVDQLLENEVSKYKSTKVSKAIDLEYDEANLLAIDQNPLDEAQLEQNCEDYLKSLARDNVQLLLNKIWQLPTEQVEDVIVAKLPTSKTQLAREKPLPKVKPATKWEEYAKTKGIQKRKRGRMVWDEGTKDWKPRWGYGRAKTNEEDWVREVPNNANPFEDQFEKEQKERSERIAKNEYQRLRNIARANKLKVSEIRSKDKPEAKNLLRKEFIQSSRSTASLGKFDETLTKEKKIVKDKNSGMRQKFESNFNDMKASREKELAVLNSVLNKKPKLDISKAVNTTKIDHSDDSKTKLKKDSSVALVRRSKAGRKKFGTGRAGQTKKFGSKKSGNKMRAPKRGLQTAKEATVASAGSKQKKK